MAEVTARDLYNAVLSFDANVRRRPRLPQYTPHSPAGGKVIRLPAEYTRWADNVDDDVIDAFWEAITRPDYDLASKISGLSANVIAQLIVAASESDKTNGTATADEYEFMGLRLTTALHILKNAGGKYFKRYANKKRGPPYEALSRRAREAFERAARLFNDELLGRL